MTLMVEVSAPQTTGKVIYRQLPGVDLPRAIIAHAPQGGLLQFSAKRLRKALFGRELWLKRRFGFDSIDEAIDCIMKRVDACVVEEFLEALRYKGPGVVRVSVRVDWAVVRHSFRIAPDRPNKSGLPDSELRLIRQIGGELRFA
ncbi:MAG: hypothetical protein ACOYBJ_01315 [Patescibacteria group bacterium]|jgi:hypothetical protein